MRFSRFCLLSILSLSLVAAVGFVASFPGSVAHAQGIITGGITGTAVDQTGAVIPTAAIEAKSEATGVILQAKANAEGDFRIADVPIGAYTVTVSASGFTATVLSHVHVISGNETPLGKVTMGLGKTAQSVEVEASAAEIMNTESAQGELSLSTAQLATVPVAGAFDNVTLVVPGVVQTHSDAFSNTNGVNYSVNGQRGRSNNSEIDGQTNNDNSIGGPSFFFSNQDAIQEVDIITTEMGAQYGRNMGAVVNYITKSGTNTFHGSGFEYYLGSWGSSLEAGQKDTQYGFCPAGQFNSCLNDPTSAYYGYAIPKVGRFVENRWGGTLGGPVLRNKLWLFGSTFWTHEYQSGSLNTSAPGVFPDANGLQELQTDYPNNPAVAGLVQIGPYANKQGSPAPVAGTTTQVQVTDGNTVNSIEMSQVGRYLEAHVLDQEHLGRLDYDMTSKDKFYIRYAYQNNPWIPAWYLYSASVIAGGGYSAVSGITHEVGGDWTHSFTTNLANQLRYAFQQAKIGFEGGSIPTCTNSNFFPCTSTITLGPSNFSIGYGGAFPQGRDVKVNQIQDNAQWTHGRHTILFGTEIDYQNSPQFGLPNSEGSFNFSTDTGAPIATGECGSACDNGYSGLLQDSGLLGLSEGKTVIPYTEWDYGVYFQDNFKVSSSLTLNLGLRYEYFGQAINLLNKESVAQQTGSNPFWSTSLPLSATTYPTSNPDRRNIEPRIGLAYTPSNMPKMVVHAGFAMNVDPAFYNIFLDAAQAAPLILADGAIPCGPGAGVDGANVNCIPSSGNFTFGPVQAADDSLLPTGGDPRANPYWLVQKNFRNPMDETYTLGIQYQVAPAAVAEVRYVGSHTFGQFQSLNTNPDILDVQNGGFPNYGSGISVCTDPTQYGYARPNCDYGLVTTIGNTAFNIYNAMDASLTVRDFHHWTGTASYTWSRAISNASEIFSTLSGGTTNSYAQNPLNSDQGERGVDGNSYPSLWGIQLTYNEPWFTNQNGILGRLLGGYFLNTFYQYNGGQPFSLFQASGMESSAVANSAVFAGDSAAVQGEVTSNFCDGAFAANWGYGGYISQCRPILANKSAPINSVGINAGNGVYENYATGAVGDRSSFHWLWNNQAEALALNNPFPGAGRNILRGDTWNDLDASIGKNIKVTERVQVQLTMNVFNVLNRAYYGVQDPNFEDSLNSPNTFLNHTYDGYDSGTAAGGGAYYAGFGNRNVELSAHINF